MSISDIETIIGARDVSLAEVLDRVIDTGVVLEGDLMLSMAEVDLIYLGVRLVLCSVDRLGRPLTLTANPMTSPAKPDESYTARETTMFEAPPLAADVITAPPDESPIDYVNEESYTAGETTTFEAPPLAADVITAPPDESRIDYVNPEKLTSFLPPPKSGGSHPERGLAQLVLAVVELLRQLMERQAIRRMENGTITDSETERIGCNLMALANQMEEFKRLFELTDNDLNLDLGPLGHLLD